MKITYLASTNIKLIGFKDGALFVQFQKGPVYRYDAVPEVVYEALVSAESAGQFLHANIKGKYVATAVPSPFPAPAEAQAAA